MITAVAMLLVWAVWALAYDGPGWIHLLLTLGVTLLIYRVVVRGTQTPNGRDRDKGDADVVTENRARKVRR